MLHLLLHFLIPWIVALVCWRRQWLHGWLWLLTGLVIDIDHLLADPIYDASRCSIGFHPLHSQVAVVVYVTLLLSSLRWPDGVWWYRIRIFLIGVMLHLVLDAADCVF